jgi:phosphoesterase RecJ-like protein
MMKSILTHLKSCKRVLVASHVNPDGDAIGSLIAMGLTMKALGKGVTMYNESPMPAVYQFLPAIDSVADHVTDFSVYDTAVVLDCGNLERIGSDHAAVGAIPVVINIDHHVTNTGFGDLQAIDTDACASAELVYRLIRELDVTISEAMAWSIYTGILTATGSFRFSNTNRAAFSICEEMLTIGVDPWMVAQYGYGTYSVGRIKLLNLALNTIELVHDGKVSLMTVTRRMLQRTGTRPEDADGMINYARGIEDVRLAVLIQQNGDSGPGANGNGPYHVSLRSDGSVDAAAIAAAFGGGGHASAAGFNVEAMSLAELKARILALTADL